MNFMSITTVVQESCMSYDSFPKTNPPSQSRSRKACSRCRGMTIWMFSHIAKKIVLRQSSIKVKFEMHPYSGFYTLTAMLALQGCASSIGLNSSSRHTAFKDYSTFMSFHNDKQVLHRSHPIILHWTRTDSAWHLHPVRCSETAAFLTTLDTAPMFPVVARTRLNTPDQISWNVRLNWEKRTMIACYTTFLWVSSTLRFRPMVNVLNCSFYPGMTSISLSSF